MGGSAVEGWAAWKPWLNDREMTRGGGGIVRIAH